MSAPRCLVLGGTGFIGSAIAAEAVRRGWATTAVGSKDVESVYGETFDLVVNANGNARKYLAWENPALDFDLSVRSAAHSLLRIRAGRYVFVSSSEVYPDPGNPANNSEETPIREGELSPYGFHKWLAERLVRRWAARWMILRLSGLVGPRLKKNAVYDLLTGAPLRVHPESSFQFLDTRDLARILFDLLDRAGGETLTLNLGGRGTVTLAEIAGRLGAPLPADADDLPLIACELNLDRAAGLIELPATEATIRAFLREWPKLREAAS